jgi:glycine cleavage system H protein
MSHIPEELRYATTHEWVRMEDDGNVYVGISDHAQDSLGDLVFVEPPEVGDEISTGDECGVVESVKAASDIYAPMSGEVIAVNENLDDSPELVNQDPYGDGWIYQLKPANKAEFDELLSADDYATTLEDDDD